MNQRGFATLEVILMVIVIGILAAIAVPRFDSVTTSANTARIQADLSTIDTAIAIYQMENGTPDSAPDLKDLAPYLKDAEKIEPPKGKCYINGTPMNITDTDKYEISEIAISSIDDSVKDYRATLKEHQSVDFHK